MRRLIVLVLALLLVAFSFSQVKNIIYFIGDGMGLSQAYLTSLIEGRPLSFMKTPYTGLVKTHSVDSWVTDSAAAGTALASGFKTKNGMINVLPDGTRVPTIFEIAKAYGAKTGIVVTCRVTHATPAAFYAHVKSRSEENEIARQLVESETVDLVMGGGWANFLPESLGGKRSDGLNLIEMAKKKGYVYVTKKEDLMKLPENTEKVLALFAPSHLDPASSREEQPMLYEMVKKALEILSNDEEPFFLMVEGSQIDWEAHDNDIYGVWKEVVEFDRAVQVALDFALKRGDTLVIVTADHETGGLALSSGDYRVDVDRIRKFSKTTDWILANYSLKDRESFKKAIEKYFGLTLSDSDLDRITSSNNSKVELGRVLSEKVNVGWTTTSHSGVPVPIYAFGPGAENFTGFLDNTDIPRIMMKLAGYSLQYPLVKEPVK
ncbi:MULTISPECIES: alkaline phosphatase [Thermotoga]|uniref:Alkaline phosphatase n=1 Tax=Thermotoga neapolitana TaxID=2337 RepID=Q4KRH8_THENE|nr:MULTISPECIES: alkaline phosphatase [Thermotoga]AAX98659.1 alkaline phosphatase precursor [Thermotoga neapolitana]MDK2785609.1 alkaline phosphatase [Thermotoga sp.]AJG40654.1 alkaline phosphatase [Thermotoga sp. RQ7]KFZ22335.1 Alkaline phosphatase precursor [Thermotoga neapolitana LA10]HBF10843.1 alkaline phosphatase [Thermotoga neapolitana]